MSAMLTEPQAPAKSEFLERGQMLPKSAMKSSGTYEEGWVAQYESFSTANIAEVLVAHARALAMGRAIVGPVGVDAANLGPQLVWQAEEQGKELTRVVVVGLTLLRSPAGKLAESSLGRLRGTRRSNSCGHRMLRLEAAISACDAQSACTGHTGFPVFFAVYLRL